MALKNKPQKTSKPSAHAVDALKTSPVRQATPSATGQGGRPGQYQGMTAIEPTRLTVGARTDQRVMTQDANAAKTKLLLEAMKDEGAE